ncbi:MAG: hypothetical protein ACJ79A_14915 [Gemmatimonadaceae bacterium]
MTFSFFELLLLFAAGMQSVVRADTTVHTVPFDTTLAVATGAHLAIDVGTGGAIRIIGGESKTIGVHVSERGPHCAECVVTVAHAGAAVQVRIRRGAATGAPADLQVAIDVPVQCAIELASAGGPVEIEGIDGTLTGATQSGALSLRRISGAVELQTRRGDITLRESYVSGSLRTLDGRVLFEDVGGSVVGTSAKGRVILRRVERADSRH